MVGWRFGVPVCLCDNVHEILELSKFSGWNEFRRAIDGAAMMVTQC